MRKLSEGADIEDFSKDINQIDANSIIIQRLLELFPSYYGKFISLNFARYLTGTIETEEQMKVFGDIIEFFDNVPELDIPSALQEFMDEYLDMYSSEDGVKKINAIIQGKSGYYDVFIPAMRKLSLLYNEYYEQMLVANEKFVREHPEYVE